MGVKNVSFIASKMKCYSFLKKGKAEIMLFPHWKDAVYYFAKCYIPFCISDTIIALLQKDIHYTHAANSVNSI